MATVGIKALTIILRNHPVSCQRTTKRIVEIRSLASHRSFHSF